MIVRLFCRSDELFPLGKLVETLHQNGFPAVPHFRGDDLGWTAGTLTLTSSGGSPVPFDRYLTDADDLRPDLNRFAAELETLDYSPNHRMLMEWAIQTRQLIAFRRPVDHADESRLEDFCDLVAQTICARLDGVYQKESAGWFAADGTLLLEEY